MQTSKLVSAAEAADLNNHAQVTAAGRFWSLCVAQELASAPRLRPQASAPTFLEDRKSVELVGAAAKRVVNLVFGVVLRDLGSRPDLFRKAIGSLSGSIAQELGENLQGFSFDERLAMFTALSQALAQGMNIGLAAEDDAA